MKTKLPEGCPLHSPWGGIQSAELIVPGIYSVGTPSHGGIFVAGDRLDRIPLPFRETPFNFPSRDPLGHWFEEDVGVTIVMAFFQEFFPDENWPIVKNHFAETYSHSIARAGIDVDKLFEQSIAREPRKSVHPGWSSGNYVPFRFSKKISVPGFVRVLKGNDGEPIVIPGFFGRPSVLYVLDRDFQRLCDTNPKEIQEQAVEQGV